MTERRARMRRPERPPPPGDTTNLHIKVGGGDTMGAFQLIVWCKDREPDIHTGGGCSEASEGPWTPWRRFGSPPPPPEEQQNVLFHEEGS